MIAGYAGGWLGNVIMRLADVIMSFPSLLMAVVVLYMFEPRVANLVLVLALTRIPLYLRTCRAEVLEVRERMFVSAARVMGASRWRILFRHIAPIVVPTLITVATLDFAFVMLAESALSFLGIGIQPPEITWGLMVAQGRNYLASAWWLAFWPGLAIMLTTMALNLLASWVRIAADPEQRWRLEVPAERPEPAGAMSGHLLEIQDLAVEFHTAAGTVKAVDGINYHLDRGETLAILGESGSGKSVSASAIMNLIDSPPGYITRGRVLYRGEDLLTMPAEARREINGKKIAMIFQDTLAHLNPVYSIGYQIAETFGAHDDSDSSNARERTVDLLGRVGIPDPERRVDDYPHQFSGGQRQRVMIAMALAFRPDILIADEPTTALDVTVQAQILKLLRDLQQETGMGLILITHDLGVVAETADRVAVMHRGKTVETGPVRQVFHQPRHAYTQKLIAAIPGARGAPALTPEAQEAGNAGMPLLLVKGLAKHYVVTKGLMRRATGEMVRAVDGVSFDLHAGETLGIVGESGSGKSTLARTLLRLEEPTSGEALFRGQDIFSLKDRDLLDLRRQVQVVFQDPYASLNPRMTVADIIAEPFVIHSGVLPKNAWLERVGELLVQVGMHPEHARRYPHQFSGGQRQRIAIARALALQPEIIICDEAVSALDVSIQAQVIELLADLKNALGLAYIFIAHDLPVIRDFADRVLVMHQGKIVEQGHTQEIFDHPEHPYTQALLAASPVPDPDCRVA